MKNRIEIGDWVVVKLSSGNAVKGTVSYMPAVTDDSWIIVDIDGWIHYIQTFEEIIKYVK